MDRDTGKILGGVDEIRASIREILFTPVGSIPLFREFGSELFDLVDAPQNQDLLIRARVIDAIEKWEPRVRVQSVDIEKGHETGRITINVFFKVVDSGESSEVRASI